MDRQAHHADAQAAKGLQGARRVGEQTDVLLQHGELPRGGLGGRGRHGGSRKGRHAQDDERPGMRS